MTHKSGFILSLLFCLCCGPREKSQDDTTQVIDLIQEMHASDSSVFITDLQKIDSSLLHYMMKYRMPDSAYQSIAEFMAGSNDDWQATDAVLIVNGMPGKTLPSRRLIYALQNSGNTVLFYWQGGVGRSLHVTLMEDNDSTKISGFWGNNSDLFDSLERQGEYRPPRDVSDVVTYEGAFMIRGVTLTGDSSYSRF